jgi:hypothetical protein
MPAAEIIVGDYDIACIDRMRRVKLLSAREGPGGRTVVAGSTMMSDELELRLIDALRDGQGSCVRTSFPEARPHALSRQQPC